MLIKTMILTFLSLFMSVKLASSTDIYIVKVGKEPINKVSRNQNELLKELILRLRPFQSKIGKSERAHEDHNKGNDKYHLPCRPGQICIAKVQHNENSVVINNGLRHKGITKKYANYHNWLEDTTDTDAYVDYDVPFTDLTRFEDRRLKQTKRNSDSQKVSTDYLDLNDFLRALNKNKKTEDYRKAADAPVKDIPRAYSSDSSDVSNEDSSMKSDDTSEKGIRKKRIPKRFEVVNNGNKKKTYVPSDDSEPVKSDEDTEVEEYEPTTKRPKKKKSKKKNNSEPVVVDKKEIYMQSPGVFIKMSPDSDEDSRKRLQHFLPKRYHWDTDDFQKLGYYWFNGPQGKYPGPWRIRY